MSQILYCGTKKWRISNSYLRKNLQNWSCRYQDWKYFRYNLKCWMRCWFCMFLAGCHLLILKLMFAPSHLNIHIDTHTQTCCFWEDLHRNQLLYHWFSVLISFSSVFFPTPSCRLKSKPPAVLRQHSNRPASKNTYTHSYDVKLLLKAILPLLIFSIVIPGCYKSIIKHPEALYSAIMHQ